MSEEGGLEELLEFFSRAAILALSRSISSRSSAIRLSLASMMQKNTVFSLLTKEQFQTKLQESRERLREQKPKSLMISYGEGIEFTHPAMKAITFHSEQIYPKFKDKIWFANKQIVLPILKIHGSINTTAQ